MTMSVLTGPKSPPTVLQQGGVIGPDERLPWPQTAVPWACST
jgi:putative pyrimidine permease RutG